MSRFNIAEFGVKLSTTYGMYLGRETNAVSSWHDIPLYADKEKKYVNMVVEIPRWTNAKMEITKNEKLNPIKQDVKKDKLRYVDNVYPYKGYIWNYGAVPQTWENPNHVDKNTQAKGDNDPLDICEIGEKIFPRGSVIAVKILGVLAMIDEGETDWKVIAIAKDDPLEKKINDLNDIEKHMPGFLDDTRRWFKVYKIPQGKPANTFAFSGEYKNKQFAQRIVEETNQFWRDLVMGKTKANDCNCENATIEGSPFKLNEEGARSIVAAAPPLKPAEIPIDAKVEKWYFVAE